MKVQKQKLLIEQLDRKMQLLKPLDSVTIPSQGWIFTIRTALGMSLRQLALRINITAQSMKEIENREVEGGLTLKGLNEVGKALNMRFVYGFIPLDDSIEKMIEKQALKIAKEVVWRTSNSMSLEDQENNQIRLEKAVKSRMEEIKNEIPRYLWD
ncbi:MAG: mobile mystery protein A [Prolixibacteraceae bacterium]|nr:mobile mystery protein A [Prolixibacteraceae bacterium]